MLQDQSIKRVQSFIVSAIAVLLWLTPAMAQKSGNRVPSGIEFNDDLDTPLNTFLESVEGEYQGQWPGAFAKRLDIDLLPAWVVFKVVSVPSLSSRVLYHEVREGDDTGRVVRQRLIAFDDDPNRSHNFSIFYPIENASEYERADLKPEILADITKDDVRDFGRGCQMNMIGQGGAVRLMTHSTSCILIWSGTAHYTGLEMIFRDGGFSFQESSYDLNGNLSWGREEPSHFIKKMD